MAISSGKHAVVYRGGLDPGRRPHLARRLRWCRCRRPGVLAVFTHPFFGVSNDHGIVELNNLPAGTFQVQAWHETYGVQTQSVSVAAGETKEITFSYKAKGA
jgi:hypothetical protein